MIAAMIESVCVCVRVGAREFVVWGLIVICVKSMFQFFSSVM